VRDFDLWFFMNQPNMGPWFTSLCLMGLLLFNTYITLHYTQPFSIRIQLFNIHILYSSSIHVWIWLFNLRIQLVNIRIELLIFCFNVPLQAVGVPQNV
jgi:hypothetical protein